MGCGAGLRWGGPAPRSRSGGEHAAAGGAGVLRLDDPRAQRGELGQLRVDAAQDGLQAPALGLAGGAAGVVRGERVDRVIEREADRLQLAREPDPLDRGRERSRGSPTRCGRARAGRRRARRTARCRRCTPGARRPRRSSCRAPLTLDHGPESTLRGMTTSALPPPGRPDRLRLNGGRGHRRRAVRASTPAVAALCGAARRRRARVPRRARRARRGRGPRAPRVRLLPVPRLPRADGRRRGDLDDHRRRARGRRRDPGRVPGARPQRALTRLETTRCTLPARSRARSWTV